jgi:hypothetical protein
MAMVGSSIQLGSASSMMVSDLFPYSPRYARSRLRNSPPSCESSEENDIGPVVCERHKALIIVGNITSPAAEYEI